MPGRRHRKANRSPTRQHCRGPNILGRIARSSGRACSVIQSHDQLSADRKTPTSPSRQMERGHCSERHLPNGESRLNTVCGANAKLAGLGCYNVGRCHCVVRYAIAVSTWPGSKQLSGACFFQSVILISSACSAVAGSWTACIVCSSSAQAHMLLWSMHGSLQDRMSTSAVRCHLSDHWPLARLKLRILSPGSCKNYTEHGRETATFTRALHKHKYSGQCH